MPHEINFAAQLVFIKREALSLCLLLTQMQRPSEPRRLNWWVSAIFLFFSSRMVCWQPVISYTDHSLFIDFYYYCLYDCSLHLDTYCFELKSCCWKYKVFKRTWAINLHLHLQAPFFLPMAHFTWCKLVRVVLTENTKTAGHVQTSELWVSFDAVIVVPK